MGRFDFRETTENCFNLALKDLTEALSLYEQKRYVLSEKKIADVIYRTTSALHLISQEKEQYHQFDKEAIDT